MTLIETEWEVPKATISTGEVEGDMTRRDILAVSSVKRESTESNSTGLVLQEKKTIIDFLPSSFYAAHI